MEYCNGEDDDCDELVDEEGAIGRQTFFLDQDGDGYGTQTTSADACSAPESYVLNDNDCNDDNLEIYPGAPEGCSMDDMNCDGADPELCSSCLELLEEGAVEESGVYTISVSSISGAQDVYCDMVTDGGGWTQFSFIGVDSEGYDNSYSAVFSTLNSGFVGVGSFKVDASELVFSAEELRYSEPAESTAETPSTTNSWAHDFTCELSSQVLANIIDPGLMDQPAASISCTNLNTGSVSANAVLMNYQAWTGCWSEPRLWIGSDEEAHNYYHGNYCTDCVVTWKCSNNTIQGTYQAPSGNYNQAVAFWLR